MEMTYNKKEGDVELSIASETRGKTRTLDSVLVVRVFRVIVRDFWKPGD